MVFIYCAVAQSVRALNWEVEGFGCKPQRTQITDKNGMCAGRALLKVPLSKVPNSQKALLVPCNELATHPGVCPASPICS